MVALKSLENKKCLKNELVHKITVGIVERDYRFINGKRETKNPDYECSYTDPNLMHICYFGFLGKSAGLIEYGRMFFDVTNFIKINHKHLDMDTIKNLREVIKFFNRTHENTQVAFDI